MSPLSSLRESSYRESQSWGMGQMYDDHEPSLSCKVALCDCYNSTCMKSLDGCI